MAVITLSWGDSYYTPRTEAYTNPTPWIQVVRWRRNDNNNLLPLNGLGVYIIIDSTAGAPGVPVYVGQALSFRDRFDGRSNTLREFGLTGAALNNRVVRVATVNPQNELDDAERWLIRYLYLRDIAVNNPRRMQNIEKTGPFYAPIDDLTIINNGTRPAYLNAQYDYDADDPIIYP
jgi:hypothetical protein